MNDLSYISSHFFTLSQNLSVKINTQSVSTFSPEISPLLELQEKKRKASIGLGDRLIDLESQDSSLPVSTLGHLIPLSCGHNGVPHYMEMEVYKYHLKNSGLFK